MSPGIGLRIYTRTIPKRDSKAHRSSNVSRLSPALSSWAFFFAFCFCLDARTFLEDRSEFLSDALLSEVAHFSMTFFGAVMV